MNIKSNLTKKKKIPDLRKNYIINEVKKYKYSF